MKIMRRIRKINNIVFIVIILIFIFFNKVKCENKSDIIEKIANFIKSLQKDDGGFSSFYHTSSTLSNIF